MATKQKKPEVKKEEKKPEVKAEAPKSFAERTANVIPWQDDKGNQVNK
jgi:hypothetical protein